MKRFLSWVVLCVLSAVVSIVLGLVSIVLVGIYNWLLSLNGIIKIIASWFVYCGIGSIHIVLPIMLSTYVMITSEKIRKSKNGIRYIIYQAEGAGTEADEAPAKAPAVERGKDGRRDKAWRST